MVLNRRSRELPHAMFCPSFRSDMNHPLNGPTNLSRFEKFPGAACLTKFAAVHAPSQMSRDLSGTIQSGSPPV